MSEKTGSDLWLLPLQGEQKPGEFLATPNSEIAPDLSPNGNYVAYMSNETGNFEAYVKPVPSADGKRFLLIQDMKSSRSRPPAITVVQNWFAEFSAQQKKQ